MYYKEDWEKSVERYKALWECEIVDRCCVSVTSLRRGYEKRALSSSTPDATTLFFRNRRDPEAAFKECKENFESLFFGGDAVPQVWFNYGPAGLAAHYTDFKVDGTTTWYDPIINDWDSDIHKLESMNSFLDEQLEMAKYLVTEGKDLFLVSTPDNAGVLDALAALRGSGDLLADMLEKPEIVHTAVSKLMDTWLYANDRFYDITSSNGQKGSSIGWLSIWAPGKLSQLQSDISVMISNDMFRDFVVPELTRCSESQDYSLYHFDGIEQVRHLDDLLSIPEIGMIQWTSVVGQPDYMHNIDTLKRIQAAGKGLLVNGVHPKDIETLMENLSHRGLIISTGVETQDEAEAVVQKVAKLTCDR